MTSSSTRPLFPRQHSVPGGFLDTDDDLSPVKVNFDRDESSDSLEDTTEDAMKYEQGGDDSSILHAPSGGDSVTRGDESAMDEKEMQRKLMDLESSFSLPALSPAGQQGESGMDDTSVYGLQSATSTAKQSPSVQNRENTEAALRKLGQSGNAESSSQRQSSTPPGMYQTPAPGWGDSLPDRGLLVDSANGKHANTSALETMSSSPTAAAAARTVSRVVSMASIGGYETADDRMRQPSSAADNTSSTNTTPRENEPRPSSPGDSSTPTRPGFHREMEDAADGDVEDEDSKPKGSVKRPKYLSRRLTSHRSSYSSHHSYTTTSGASDITLGADYALQSGGAAPFSSSTGSRPSLELSRSASLASMGSGISALSDGEDRIRSISGGLENFDTLAEEDYTPKGDRRARVTGQDQSGPQTPTATSTYISTPTDTVIAQHVKNVEVPATIAREYRERNRTSSPEKKNGTSTSRSRRNLTVREENNTIDRLKKENFGLKLKITFLDDALNKRSDEGVKSMISENVDLRTSNFNLKRDFRGTKRTIRDLGVTIRNLEASLRERTEGIAAHAKDVKDNVAKSTEDVQGLETEIIFLREKTETSEVEILKLSNEKQRLAQIVKSMTERRSGNSDIGVREEMDHWKDLLYSETARREEADEENKKLREEISRLKLDLGSSTSNGYPYNNLRTRDQRQANTLSSHTTSSDRSVELDGFCASCSTLVEPMRHEHAELRREVGAQASMLTSRNREREGLYQEIEDLKLRLRRGEGSRSATGDSILERSASRAHGRPISRASNVTPSTQMSDAERESYEIKIGENRDQISELKLRNQGLVRDMEGLLDELDEHDQLKVDHANLEQLYDTDLANATEDLQALQRERDEEMRIRDELEVAFQDLKAEARQNIDELEEEVEQKFNDLKRLEKELANRTEESTALRDEVRSMSEGLIRVEDDVRLKIRKIQELELENEDLNRELESIEKSLLEANTKNERLGVQQESSQNEIAFLREEQDSDKIRIGDLETALKNVHASLSIEKDRAKDLDARLTEERHQREVIGSKEKQEVQKMMSDLNREVSTTHNEARTLQESLQAREEELTTWKQRLTEFESSLQEVLGDSHGTRSSFITSITKLQRGLDSTASDLNTTKAQLSEKERLLRNRDALLESHGLESRKLSDLLERERQGRRTDKAQHEQWQKTHQHTSRTVTQKDSRISELESSRQADRKKLATLEQHFRDQLNERNSLLLTLWSRLSSLCGSDWQHQNSLINGHHLPTLEVVSNLLPGFSKNLLFAVKTIETLVAGFKSRVRSVERDLWKEYQSLEHGLEVRVKKLDRLESVVQSHRLSAAQGSNLPEVSKLRGENRLLKAELAVLQKQDLHARQASRGEGRASSSVTANSSRGEGSGHRASMSATLMRHHSSSAVEALEKGSNHGHANGNVQSAPLEPSQQRWIHRLRELERRLKAEREARLLDRSGARKRLEEGRAENEELRAALERERVRRGES